MTPLGRLSIADFRFPIEEPASGWATQNTSVFATGLAARPVPRMSRMTPPAPVALPPYGSIALGGLCVSTLKQTASVSSKATTPALSLKTERQNGPPVPWASSPCLSAAIDDVDL